MSEIDYLGLDGHALKLFLAVFDEGSVTRAAQRLGVTQGAVSHGLDKLRAIAGDSLFVKSGRGIVATAQAAELARRARLLLDEMRAFSQAAGFEPRRLNTCITIAANDLQRDLLLPGLLRRLRMQAPGLSLRVIPSGAPQAALLRDQACDLLITPRPPEATDVLQQRLFEDPYRVFYDPAERQAPLTLDDYLAAEHVSVLYEPRRSLDVDEHLQAMGHRRRFVAWVPGLAALGAMLRGGPWLATAPGLLAQTSLQGLAHSPPPMPLPLLPMYLVWHQRHHRDPAHQWLRGVLVALARADLGRASPSARTLGSG